MVHHMRSDGEDRGDSYGWWGYRARCDENAQGRAGERALVAGVGVQSGVSWAAAAEIISPLESQQVMTRPWARAVSTCEMEDRATGESGQRPWVGMASGAGLF